jgi:hypothetical protein
MSRLALTMFILVATTVGVWWIVPATALANCSRFGC